MGGSGSSTTTGLIPPELRGLYTGSANSLLDQQGANPLGQYNEANPMDVAGANSFMNMGASLIGGGAQPSGLDALSLQAILRQPGLAGAGPTTGQYDYGNEASLQDIGGFMNPTSLTGPGLTGFDMRGGAVNNLPGQSYGQASEAPDYSMIPGAAGQFGSQAERGMQGPLGGPGGGSGGPGGSAPPPPGGGPGGRPSHSSESWDARAARGEFPPGVSNMAEYQARRQQATGQTGTIGERTLRGANHFSQDQINDMGFADVMRDKWIDTRGQVQEQKDMGGAAADRVTRDLMASQGGGHGGERGVAGAPVRSADMGPAPTSQSGYHHNESPSERRKRLGM